MQTAFKQKPPIQLNWEKKYEKTELKIHHHCFRTMIKHIKFRKTINKSHCHLPFALPNVWFTVQLLNWVHDVRIVNIKNGNNQRTKIKIDRATATNKKVNSLSSYILSARAQKKKFLSIYWGIAWARSTLIHLWNSAANQFESSRCGTLCITDKNRKYFRLGKSFFFYLQYIFCFVQIRLDFISRIFVFCYQCNWLRN